MNKSKEEYMKTRKTGIITLDTTVKNDFLNTPNIPTARLKTVFAFLSEKIFQIEGKSNYKFYSGNKKEIVSCSNKEELINRTSIEYTGHKVSGYDVESKEIKSYIESVMMTVKGVMAMPLAGPIAKWKGGYYLNSFRDDAFVPDTDVLTSEEIQYVEEYLALLAEGNFNITEYKMTYEKFIDIVVNNNFEKGSKEELLNFFFAWVAGIYQRPGIMFPTVPCFFGSVHGTGKGTLAGILSHIIGNCNDNTSQKTTEGRFNSITDGKLIMFYNEVANHPTFYNDIIKGENSEQTRIIESKGVDAYEIINVSNIICFSNNLTPFKIDEGDRRVVVIQTIGSQYGADLRHRVGEYLSKIGIDGKTKLAEIIAKILLQIDFEKCGSLFNSIMTPAKELLEQAYKSPIERFFEDKEVKFFDLNDSKAPSLRRKTSIKALGNMFSEWIETDNSSGLSNVSGKYQKTKDSFKTDIKKFALEGKYITTSGKDQYYFTEQFYNDYVNAQEETDSKPLTKREQILKSMGKI